MSDPAATPSDDATTRPLAIETRLIQAGRPAPAPDAPVNPPVVLSSTFHAGGPWGYAREGTASMLAVEEALGLLEGGHAVAFGSGMAAVNAALDRLPVGALVVAPRFTYTGTAVRLEELAAAGRLRLRTVDPQRTDEVAVACQGADLLWLESPTNPMLEVADLAACTRAAHAAGARVLCDNTFATPLNQRPLDLGADLVLHSVTKFLAGHSDLLMGALVAGSEAAAEEARERRVVLGAAPGALECFLALRGMRTLPLRLRRGEASAAVLAARLREHPAVTRVRYPGLPDDPGHPVAARQMAGFGAVLAIETAGGAADAERVCAAVRVWTHATSLGGVESLVERRRSWPAERAGVPETLLRLSVGVEDVEDLWDDLERALRTVPVRVGQNPV